MFQLSTTPSHCTLMAYSVQWLSQSNYNICIGILEEFYKFKLFVMEHIVSSLGNNIFDRSTLKTNY